jgi:hypothetical protein
MFCLKYRDHVGHGEASSEWGRKVCERHFIPLFRGGLGVGRSRIGCRLLDGEMAGYTRTCSAVFQMSCSLGTGEQLLSLMRI